MLTNCLVNIAPAARERRRPGAGSGAWRRPGRRAGSAGRTGSRQRILAAAAQEFSARGFAGAGIDRIARRARLNKAMIYYHFAGKQALYEAVLEDLYVAVAGRLGTVAAGPGTPAEKIDTFIEVLAQEVEARRHLLPVILREMAAGGPRLRRQTLEMIGGIFRVVSAIIAEGVRTGAFRPTDPVMAFPTMIGPIVVFRASAPVRARIGRLGIADISANDSRAFVSHLQAVTRRMLSR